MNDMLSGGGEGINKDDVVRFFNALARGWDDEISVDKDKIEFILDRPKCGRARVSWTSPAGQGCCFRST